MVKRWVESIVQNVVATVLVAAVPGAAVLYLAKFNSQWSTPILMGLVAFVLSTGSLLLLRVQIGLPKKRVVPTTENIEELVWLWLKNFQMKVQNAPTAETYFRVGATTDSGVLMVIGRPRAAFDSYVLIRSDVNPSQAEMTLLDTLGERRASDMALDINLELARQQIGHTNIGFPLKPFNLFKRVPINDGLTEHLFVEALEGMEASIKMINIVFLKLQNAANAAKQISQ